LQPAAPPQPPPLPPEGDSVSQRAYRALRAEAVSYRFAPGERLSEHELSRRLGFSRTPLREALHRLASEGLVVAGEGRGFRARSLQVREVEELYELRLGLETQIARLAARRITPEQAAALEAFLDRSAAACEAADVETLLHLDEGFHERLAEATGNGELLRALRALNARIYFFRWVDMQGRRGTTQGEHRAILRAVAAGDAEAAASALAGHIGRRGDQIAAVVKEGYARLYMGEGPDPRRLTDIEEEA